ncbi:right-handed parallel beta-helix repeat-containing protein [Haloarcula nitratireducens]|uniref:Right-handed parallel beta-helix repeat-containing protein n=1 Tax=Haloarcula nitratireducens TaxID=2487749 RepID=A0AAW4PAF8_9EURY|nr:right-handed parallel beta-helix repeat-containing protein [Halomicroarcula nitratireducens]MBX0294455.1 right-handed parallel beta-helix repeat-containing protein [Halomicroarcula nitratireducens]
MSDITNALRRFVDDGGPTLVRAAGEAGTDETIQAAHDALGDHWRDGGIVLVLPSYDPEREEFPIRWSKTATLRGGNHTVIENADDSVPTLIVDVDAPVNRPPGPNFNDFTIRGGKHGVEKRGGRYTMFRDVTVKDAAEDGFHVAGAREYDAGENPPNEFAPNTHRFYGCVAEENGRDGWRVGEGIHGVTLASSNAYFNGRDGVNWRQNYAGHVEGGSFEQNGRNGLRFDRAQALEVENAYVEKNGRAAGGGGMTIGVLVGERSRGVSFSDCYFQGGGDVSWGVYNQGRGTSLRNCYARGHTNGFVYNAEAARDTEWARASHTLADGERLGGGDGVRTRDHGVVVPQDLSTVTGQFDGDRGVHLGSDGPVFCLWYDGAWYRPDGSAL